MIHELRILNGLHRGAALPLDEDSLSIGASEDDDVVLVDPGIENCHAKLSKAEDGWRLIACNGDIYQGGSAEAQPEFDLTPGEFARIGQTWVTLSSEGAPWETVPAELSLSALHPPAPPEDEPVVPQVLAMDAGGADTSDISNISDTSDAMGATDDTSTASHADEGRVQQRAKLRRALLLPLSVVVLATAAAAYAVSSKPAAPTAITKASEQSNLEAKIDGLPASSLPATERPLPLAEHPLPEAERPLPAAERHAPLTGEGLREAFRKRLTGADLINRFDLQLGDDAWSMQANLDDEETARFERVLKMFVVEHEITFPINAKIVSAEGMLPFKIRQIASGSNASIVTSEGDRIYVGDIYRGIRLAAVTNHKLTFVGKRKVEVHW